VVNNTIAVREPATPVKREQNTAQKVAAFTRDRSAERFIEQESKRAPQFQIDQTATLGILGGLAAIMFIATAILTADGTISSAALSRFADPWQAFVLFGAVEVAILVFMLTYYVKGSREKGPQVTGWFVAMIAASGVAIALSSYHVIDLYDFAWTDPDMWVGVSIRFVVSLFFVLVSKAMASVLFAEPVHMNAPKLGRPRKEK